MKKTNNILKTQIIIFGKHGQVASSLINNLAKEKIFDVESYSSSEIDFRDLKKLQNFLTDLTNKSKKPEFIINCSAYTNVDKAEDEKELADLINHQAVEKIANFCQQNQVKLIHYSTDYVFDGSGIEPFKADNSKNLQPLNYYGKTKLWGEEAIIKSGCQYLILRVSWVYDKRPNSRNFVNTIKRLATEKEILTIVDDQFGSPTSADFIAQNTIQIIKKLSNQNNQFPSGIYHLGNNRFISWYQFALEIIEDLKKSRRDLKVKEVRAIKTRDYPTKAQRPLNSRLNSIGLSGFDQKGNSYD